MTQVSGLRFFYFYFSEIYILARNQGTNEVARAKPVGKPASQPIPLTNEAIPINVLPPLR